MCKGESPPNGVCRADDDRLNADLGERLLKQTVEICGYDNADVASSNQLGNCFVRWTWSFSALGEFLLSGLKIATQDLRPFGRRLRNLVENIRIVGLQTERVCEPFVRVRLALLFSQVGHFADEILHDFPACRNS